MKKTPRINSQVRWAAVKLLPKIGLSKPLPVGDWSGRRARSAARQVKLAKFSAKLSPPPSDVEISNFSCPRPDGTILPLRLYRKRGSRSLALIVYVHGGGMIMGTFNAYD